MQQKKILFVCTGNTCRSPMAMAIFNRMAKEKNLAGWSAESAGSSTKGGEGANPNAVAIFPELANHRSRSVTSEILSTEDLVLCMGQSNVDAIKSLDTHGKAITLKGYLNDVGDIKDPFNKPQKDYDECAKELTQHIGRLIMIEKLVAAKQRDDEANGFAEDDGRVKKHYTNAKKEGQKTSELIRIPTILAGVAGEYYVAAELSRRGFIASVSLKNTRGIDILATNQDGTKSITIQVKTNQLSSLEWILNSKAEGFVAENHFYVFVSLSSPLDRPNYHIVPSADVAKRVKKDHDDWLAAPGRNGNQHQDNNVRKFRDSEKQYAERWDLLGLDSTEGLSR